MSDQYYIKVFQKTVRALQVMDEHFTLLLEKMEEARARSFAPSPVLTTVLAQFDKLSKLQERCSDAQSHASVANQELEAAREAAVLANVQPGVCLVTCTVSLEKAIGERRHWADLVSTVVEEVFEFCTPGVDALKTLAWPTPVTAPRREDSDQLHLAFRPRMRSNSFP